MRVSHQKKKNNESSFEYLYINNLEYTDINWQVQIFCPTKYDLRAITSVFTKDSVYFT